MTLVNLCILYLLVGVACAVAIYRRGPGHGLHAALALPLWPLWAPVALSEPPPPPVAHGDLPGRIERALREGVEVAGDSPLRAMLNAQSAARISRMAQDAAARLGELSQLLQRPEFCTRAADARVERDARGDNPRSLAAARLHQENVLRMHRMASQDRQVLQELAELAEGLRTQLLMARFAGASAAGIGDIIGDLWSRVEALSEAMDGQPRGGVDGGIAAHTGGG